MNQAEGLLQVDLALVRNTSHPADPGLHLLVTAALQDLVRSLHLCLGHIRTLHKVVRPSHPFLDLVVSRQDHQVQWVPQAAHPSHPLLEWARPRLDSKAVRSLCFLLCRKMLDIKCGAPSHHV